MWELRCVTLVCQFETAPGMLILWTRVELFENLQLADFLILGCLQGGVETKTGMLALQCRRSAAKFVTVVVEVHPSRTRVYLVC